MNTEKVKRSSRGRPISFDKGQLVQSVMHKFWEQGYNNVSLNEIARDNGLTRASLYHSFDSKEALFLQALNLYIKNSPDALLDNLDEDVHVGDTFFSLMDRISEARAADERHRGCMVFNCINELITSDSALAKQLTDVLEKRRQRVNSLFAIAVKNNELPQHTDVVLCSNMFLTFLCGLSTFSKTASGEQELKQLCEGFLNSLGFYRRSATQ
ncbi:TetR/AcrR family transcriptional regulator [Sessilibacter corallicola]|uniref:TetR/AcrR family transcriptional regulator n=1 Tax=Sessilibacter corallicola TaxID=2904075 RepID=A0ABQ0A5Q2_9GAMM